MDKRVELLGGPYDGEQLVVAYDLPVIYKRQKDNLFEKEDAINTLQYLASKNPFVYIYEGYDLNAD